MLIKFCTNYLQKFKVFLIKYKSRAGKKYNRIKVYTPINTNS